MDGIDDQRRQRRRQLRIRNILLASSCCRGVSSVQERRKTPCSARPGNDDVAVALRLALKLRQQFFANLLQERTLSFGWLHGEAQPRAS